MTGPFFMPIEPEAPPPPPPTLIRRLIDRLTPTPAQVEQLARIKFPCC